MTERARAGTRRAALGRSDGDVRRFAALVPALALGAAVLVAGLAMLDGPGALVSPGPLAPAHRALGCSDCHAAGRAEASCGGCHGAHPSERAGHRALVAAGKLGCRSCHAAHDGGRGVRFEPDGRVVSYGGAHEVELGERGATGLRAALAVPFVPARRCERCHDLGRASDAAAHCVLPGSSRDEPILCFDEHRAPARASAATPAERDAVLELARAAARVAPGALSARILGAHGVLLAAALAGALALLARGRRAPVPRPVVFEPGAARRLPVIDATRCLGCHACADACPYEVLEIRRYVAVVARPDACTGAGPCEERCPNGSLTLAELVSEDARPAAPESTPLERAPGLFVAGDAAGGALIARALSDGAAVAETVVARQRSLSGVGPADAFDLLVVGAGPAGLEAALGANRRGARVLVLEQASIAESIRRFSRKKLVLDAGPRGRSHELFAGDVEKEELIERWLYGVRAARLDVREGLRVVDATRVAEGGFCVRAVDGGGKGRAFAARLVLVAVGRRGTPKKLAAPVADAAVGRVHYELADARAFAGQRALVVGLGDVAMETALALAAQPGTEVTVVHRGQGFGRGRRRNVEALSRLVARGRVGLLLAARVVAVESDRVRIDAKGGPAALAYDALFVAIGSIPNDVLVTSDGVAFGTKSG